MLFINEWLPNPTGPDGDREFIELFNSGPLSVNLLGWKVAVDPKKKISTPTKTVAPGGYLILKHGDVRLALKNTGGGLWLYGPDGRLVDSASFIGSAPDGKSFSRTDYGAARIQHFLFTNPTPGTKNKIDGLAVAIHEYPPGTTLPAMGDGSGALGMLFGVAAVLPFLFLYVIQKNEKISELFFP